MSDATIKIEVDRTVSNIRQQVRSRGARAATELKNAELRVLSGERSGKVYKKAHSKATYRASAPGESPARRTGKLRLNWNKEARASGDSVSVSIKSSEKYSGYLESGTSRMVKRPIKEPIVKEALSEIEQIFNEPYS